MAAVATVAVVLGFVAWIQLQLGGERATIAVDDIGEAVAALAAAACCGWAAASALAARPPRTLALLLARQSR